MKRESLRSRWGGRLAVTASLGWVLTMSGCADPTVGRMNAPPQGHTAHKNPLADTYVHMRDNVLLADMSMSSVHFVPHSMELNSLGVYRLKRYAAILKVYGGTLRYDGAETEEELKANRMGQVRQYLVACGLDADQFEVEAGMAGGAGLKGTEAVNVRKATDFTPGEVARYRSQVGSGGGGGG